MVNLTNQHTKYTRYREKEAASSGEKKYEIGNVKDTLKSILGNGEKGQERKYLMGWRVMGLEKRF